MNKQLKAFAGGFLYIICNYFVNSIPCWTIRKLLYRLLGMRIGKHSRIMMKTIVTIPWRIKIGDNTIINEYCYLDGRGGLTIGSNVNISIYSMLVTGTHDHKSTNFRFFTEPIVIENEAWIAARCIVLNGCKLREGCIISAGSVVPPRSLCEAMTIYNGIPAEKARMYSRTGSLNVENWTVCFR